MSKLPSISGGDCVKALEKTLVPDCAVKKEATWCGAKSSGIGLRRREEDWDGDFAVELGVTVAADLAHAAGTEGLLHSWYYGK